MTEISPDRRRMRFDPSQSTRSWPVRVASLLLLLEAAGLVAVHVINLSRLDWNSLLAATGDAVPHLPEANLLALAVSLLFLPSVFLAVLAAVGLFFIWRTGWLLAMLTQGLTLAICLSLYFQEKPGVIYPIMLFCILMVLNLNSFEIRATVQDRPNRLPALLEGRPADER